MKHKISQLKRVKTKKTTEPFNSFVALIKSVPNGKVATYGQIAKLADYPGYARQVVWALHSGTRKYKLPWHRIISSQGRIATMDDRSQILQKRLLIQEGVDVSPYFKINLEDYLWKPQKSEIKRILKTNIKKYTDA